MGGQQGEGDDSAGRGGDTAAFWFGRGSGAGEERRDVAVASFPNEPLARLAAARLADAVIRSVLVPQGGGPGVFGTATLLPHELRTLTGDAERARHLLDEPPDQPSAPRRRYRKRDARPRNRTRP